MRHTVGVLPRRRATAHTTACRRCVAAGRGAPARYAQLARPRGTSVADLWSAYTLDMAGRAVVVTMSHTWKALKDRFGQIDGPSVSIADCRAHVSARRAAGISDGTIHTELGHLRMVLLWARKQKLLEAERNRIPSAEAEQQLADDPAYASPFISMPF